MSNILVRDKNCNAIVELKDGQTIEIFAEQLYDKNLHHWKGWYCNAGVDSIFIDSDFIVYAGQCENDNLGNLFNNDFSFLKSPTICRRETCTTCTTDLYTYKSKEERNDNRS
jgi:hypothetical protein